MVGMRLFLWFISQSLMVLAVLTSPNLARPQFVDGATPSGYDAVAYQEEGAAVPGEPTITTERAGTT